jgi:hypothetical protein
MLMGLEGAHGFCVSIFGLDQIGCASGSQATLKALNGSAAGQMRQWIAGNPRAGMSAEAQVDCMRLTRGHEVPTPPDDVTHLTRDWSAALSTQ